MSSPFFHDESLSKQFRAAKSKRRKVLALMLSLWWLCVIVGAFVAWTQWR